MGRGRKLRDVKKACDVLLLGWLRHAPPATREQFMPLVLHSVREKTVRKYLEPDDPPPESEDEGIQRAIARLEGLVKIPLVEPERFEALLEAGAAAGHPQTLAVLEHERLEEAKQKELKFQAAKQARLEAAAKAAEAKGAAEVRLSREEVYKAVEAEGLILARRSSVKSGFWGVKCIRTKFAAQPLINGSEHYIGIYLSALEAALAIARQFPSAAAANADRSVV